MQADIAWRLYGNILVIIDLDSGGPSVTNDAEAVIERFAKAGINVDALRIIYRDSMGQWDGLATRNGRFYCFVPLATKDVGYAIDIARNRTVWAP